MKCTGSRVDRNIKDAYEKLLKLEIFTLDETMYPGYRIICRKVKYLIE
jgi:hypothetical protein